MLIRAAQQAKRLFNDHFCRLLLFRLFSFHFDTFCIDIHSVFILKSMNWLSLESSSLPSEGLFSLLGEDYRVTTVLTTRRISQQTISHMWKAVLTAINSLLLEVDKSSAKHRRTVDYFKAESVAKLTRFLIDTKVIRMHEPFNFNSLDLAVLFIGAISYSLCGLACACNTEVCTSNEYHLLLVCRKGRRRDWPENESQLLSEKIKHFRTLAHEERSKYQTWRIGTSNVHSLEHLTKEIQPVGSIRFLHAGWNKNTEKHYNEAHRIPSVWHNTAMRETHQGADMILYKNPKMRKNRINVAKEGQSMSKMKSVIQGAKYLAEIDCSHHLWTSRQPGKQTRKNGADHIKGNTFFRTDLSLLANLSRQEELRTLLNVLNEWFNRHKIGRSGARTVSYGFRHLPIALNICCHLQASASNGPQYSSLSHLLESHSGCSPANHSTVLRVVGMTQSWLGVVKIQIDVLLSGPLYYGLENQFLSFG